MGQDAKSSPVCQRAGSTLTSKHTLSKATLAVASATLSALVLYLCAPERVDFFFWTLTHDERPLGIHMHDPRYCYRHIPGSSAVHSRSEFSVRYTIDEDGCRVTPEPAGRPRHVTLLGCSFTFGHGVEDSETYAHILGRRHWTRYKVKNRGVMGWGIEHFKLALEDDLAGERLPRAVIYGWIGEHLGRTGSPQYCRNTHSYFMDAPLAGEQAPGLREQLFASASVIHQMNEAARARDIPFFVALLSSPGLGPDGAERSRRVAMVALLEKHRVPYINLSEVGVGMFYTVDHHPKKGWHQAVAGALARSPRLARLLGRPVKDTRP